MKKARNILGQIKIIEKAYDKTVDNYRKGVKDIDLLPDDFKNSSEFIKFQKVKHSCNSNEPDIKNFLNPKKGMNFLDVGSCANLFNHSLYKWPSVYYGIDISEKLVMAMKNYALKNNIKIGGLITAEAAKMPFKNNFFDIAACIGVLEYFDIKYIAKSLKEFSRVLKPNGKIVIDFPNSENQDTKTMIKLEEYLGRTRYKLPMIKIFEQELERYFLIHSKKDRLIMVKYFLITKK